MIKSTYQLMLHAQVLVASASGITTSRDARDYVAEFRKLVWPIAAQPWALVLDMRHWQPSPADQFAILRDNTLWCMQHNLALAVVLLPANSLLAWQFVQTTNVVKREDFRSFRVTDEAELREVLQREGFPLPSDVTLSRVEAPT